jgi:RNA polymerase-binding transcription factor DksA
MATKKPARHSRGKQAPKKATKPAPRAAVKKPAVKKTVKKSAPKPVAKKKAAPKPVAKKIEKKPAPPVKGTTKVAPKPAHPVAKPEIAAAKVQKPIPAPFRKPGSVDPKSLVSIKQKVQPVIKKEPPKPSKIIIPRTTTKSSVKYEPEFTKSILDTHSTEQSQGPTMRYSDADLAEFREIIQKKLDAAKKELAYLQGLITRKDEGGDMDEARYMTMEDGSVSMEREQLSQMASRQITFIDHLEKAMMRIENKTYGICRVTGKLIDKARLRAVPHATLSIEAKQMMNK